MHEPCQLRLSVIHAECSMALTNALHTQANELNESMCSLYHKHVATHFRIAIPIASRALHCHKTSNSSIHTSSIKKYTYNLQYPGQPSRTRYTQRQSNMPL